MQLTGKTIVILVADHFRDEEVFEPFDYLEREGASVLLVGLARGPVRGKLGGRVEAEKGTVFRFLVNDERAYAANTNSLLFWMFISSVILLSIAIVFLRKQIKPILELSLGLVILTLLLFWKVKAHVPSGPAGSFKLASGSEK